MNERPSGSRPPRRDQPKRDGDRPRSDRPKRDGDRPRSDRPKRDGDRPRSDRPKTDGDRPRSDRPKTDGERPRFDKDKPRSDRPRRDDDRPRSDRPRSDRPRSDRPKRDGDRPRSDRPKRDGDRPWSDRPKRDGDRPRFDKDKPWSDRPRRDDDRPRSDRPRSDRPRSDRPRSDRPQRSGNRPGFDRPRDDFAPRVPRGPVIDADVTGEELDKAIGHELKSLGEGGAKAVAKRLVMIARYIDEQPELAWEHAQEALRSAGRLAIVREAAGLAAYHAGNYAEALRELRAHRRVSGSDEHWPVMADCERGMGRPEKALQMAGAPEVKNLTRAQAVEMRIVAAGARADLGQLDAAVVTLQCRELSMNSKDAWAARLKYAYADALLSVGRNEEALTWFNKAVEADTEGLTDAADRVAELEGIVLESLEDYEDEEA